MRAATQGGAQEGGQASFEAVIVPHRSLTARGIWAITGALCLLSLMVAAIFWHLGAWPVAGFSGPEILLAIGMLRVNARAARASELLTLRPDGLLVVRTDPGGRRTERLLPASWLRARLVEQPGRVPALILSGGGVQEEIGASLGEAEKRDLAAALQEALHRWRHPVFDNPQLVC